MHNAQADLRLSAAQGWVLTVSGWNVTCGGRERADSSGPPGPGSCPRFVHGKGHRLGTHTKCKLAPPLGPGAPPPPAHTAEGLWRVPLLMRPNSKRRGRGASDPQGWHTARRARRLHPISGFCQTSEQKVDPDPTCSEGVPTPDPDGTVRKESNSVFQKSNREPHWPELHLHPPPRRFSQQREEQQP